MNIKNLINNQYFEKQTLEKEEILFAEWDFDENLYIIISGKLKIEKYVWKDKKEQKLLATLGANEIFWEGSLSNKKAKEVSIVAKEETKVLKIKSDSFENFIKDFPALWIEILSSIIDLSNKRLLESNYLLTTTYNISKIISEKTQFNNKNLFEIIDKILEILWANYILVFEKNPVLKNYLNFEYDTRNKWKLINNIFDFRENFSIDFLKENNIHIEKNNFISELINSGENIWYLVFGEKDKSFSETQKKMMNSISVLIAWFIKQKQYIEEENNRN